MPPRILAAAGLALAGGLATLAMNASTPANAQAEFDVSAEQLRINQRISQAAVRRSNRADQRLDALEVKVNAPAAHEPAPTTTPAPPLVATFYARIHAVIPPGPPPPPPAPGGIPMILPPAPSGPPPLDNIGVTNIERVAPSYALVTFERSIRLCTWSATLGDTPPGLVSAAYYGDPSERKLAVITYGPDGEPASRMVHVTVFCPPS